MDKNPKHTLKKKKVHQKVNATADHNIEARYEDGILRLSVPKKEKKAVENNKYIAIEG